jgi:2-methylcitrate dehydratase PrpD
VHCTRAAALYPGCDVSGPFEHILQAKMSIHYNVAVALAHGDFAERNYVPQHNPAVLQLAKLAQLAIDADLTLAFPAKQGAGVTVRLRNGETLEARVEDVVPTDAAGVHERFLAAAGSAIGAPRAAELDALIANLESCTDAAELARLTRKGAA